MFQFVLVNDQPTFYFVKYFLTCSWQVPPSNMGGGGHEKSQINGNCLLLGELRAFSMVVVPTLPVMLSNTELHTTDTGPKKD